MSLDIRVSKPSIGEVMDNLTLGRAHFWAILATIFGFFFDAFDTTILSLALPSIVAEWHLDGATAGVIGSAIFWGMIVGALGLGFLSDLLGRRMVMVITVIGMALFTCLGGLAQDVPTFIALRVLVGIFAGAMIPVDLAYLAEIAPAKRRGFLMGMIGVSWPLGALLATIVGGAVLPVGGWRTLFFLAIIPAVLALAVRWLVPESPRWLAKRGRFAEAIASANRLGASLTSADDLDTEADSVEEAAERSIWANLRELFQRRYTIRTIGACLIYLLTIGPSYGWTVFVPTIIMSVFGYPLQKTILAVVLLNAASILGRLTIALTADRIPRVAAMLGSMALYFATALTMAFVIGLGAGFAGLILTLMAVYQYSADTANLFQQWIPELFPSEIRAFSASFASAWGRLAAGIVPIVFGALLGGGNTQAVFYLIAGFAVAIALTVIIFLRKSETSGRTLSATKSA
ncbi:MFS sugar transporter [Frondihabitans sucicola]|uniref:MFS sugar transporter n=1 Tax=Frondihabitans sucicola TaxID=1268041 RepID=A0ABN6Y613_9MICO|nr:MFS transporter [Frondihabitans sucicola]BDZ51436.1 MFS sugar transporter [Frondihabitans sucicola]